MVEDVEVVWEPIPGSSQEFAVDTRCNHTLYHGTRGPGKTCTQLMRFRRHVGTGYGAFWRGVIFDREFKNLSDIIAQSKRFFYAFEDGAKFYESASDLRWEWPTGEVLLFRYVKKLGDYEGYHGHEYPFIGWNELTKHPTGELYDKMMSTNRSSFLPEKDTPVLKNEAGIVKRNDDGTPVYDTIDGKPLPDIPLEVFSTTNPSGPGHNWVKRRFIDVAKNGEVVRKEFEIYDPRLQAERTVVKTQVAIFGSYKENIYLPADYIAELNLLTESNPNLRRAWLEGDWDVTAGGAIDDLWDRNIHVVPRFVVPKNWYIDRSFDWGSSHPFSVGWWAEATGEEIILPNGKIFAPTRGSLIRIEEWYGAESIGTNKGLRLSAKQIALGIIEKEIKMMRDGWILRQPMPGPADNQIRNVNESQTDTIEKKMSDQGVVWESSDKSPGSRINGLQLLRDRLFASTKGEGKAIYFMSNCNSAISTLPPLPRDENNIEDVDTDSEDHIYDEVRYRVLKGNNRIAESINLSYPT